MKVHVPVRRKPSYGRRMVLPILVASAVLAACSSTATGGGSSSQSSSETSTGSESTSGSTSTSESSTESSSSSGTESSSSSSGGSLVLEGQTATQAQLDEYSNPTKALCKKDSYTIGYDVFSGSQAFANLVTKGLTDSANEIGCVKIIKTIDNMDGPTAIANLKTLINQKIDGFVDFQVLDAFQGAVAENLASAKIPGVAIVGADLPGWPDVGAANFDAAKAAGVYLAQKSKEKYPNQQPYALVGAEPESGKIIIDRYEGAVAGIKSVYTDLPADHVIEVQTGGEQNKAFDNARSALSAVPKDAVILVTGVNDEVVAGLFQATQTADRKNVLVNSFGGDDFAFQQVCKYPDQYFAHYLEPLKWGQSSLSVILNLINGDPVPKTIGIVGTDVTAADKVVGCK